MRSSDSVPYLQRFPGSFWISVRLDGDASRVALGPKLGRLGRVAFAGLLGIAVLTACEGEGPNSPATQLPIQLPAQRPMQAAPSEGIAGDAPSSSANWIGNSACLSCHPEEGLAWRGSDHDRAMEEAGPASVEAPFAGEAFGDADQVWRFVQDANQYWVIRQAGDAPPDRLRVLYTFGVAPLQQYLVERPDGRMQALPVAWDTRKAAQGGRRWFSLNEEASAPAGDPLHWDALAYNWNSQCASCHSTRFVKGFDDAQGVFESGFAEVDVACEACHGPGKRHEAEPEKGGMLLDVTFEPWSSERWARPEGQRIASRRVPLAQDNELDVCGGCHARRSPLIDGAPVGARMLDAFRPSLLEADLYFDDGQIREEVYVWGSFLQSRMHAAGVRCSDCHDPHSLTLRRPGNALCTGCHAPTVFDQETHHGHEAGSAGSACVDCHMPGRSYMQVDRRGDHSFPVPRPAVTQAIGAPNVCATCHPQKSSGWAATAIRRGEVGGREPDAKPPPHWTNALLDEQGHARNDVRRWLEIASDARSPEWVRAGAWARYAQEASGAPPLDFLQARLDQADSLERLGLIEIARRLAPGPRVQLLAPLLEDEARSVRTASAEALLDVPAAELPAAGRSALARGLREYRHAQEANAERPEAQVNLAGIALAYGETEKARAAYARAIDRAPYFVPAYVNLADLERALGRNRESVMRLRQAVALAPDEVEVRYALGLALHRMGESELALAELAAASLAAPGEARLSLAYALALDGLGRRADALVQLEASVRRGDADPDVYQAWASLLREQGDFVAARAAGEAWREAMPNDPTPSAFLLDLKSREEN